MEYKIGVDVDGVLANFVDGYCDLAKKLHGKEVSRTPDCWEWWEKYLSKEENKAVWKEIIAHPWQFWGNLQPISLQHFQTLHNWQDDGGHTIYLITTRVGKEVQRITASWVEKFSGYRFPVLVSDGAQAKGRIAAGLGLTHFVDDNADNIREVIRNVPGVTAKLYHASHNHLFPLERVEKLEDLLVSNPLKTTR